jgi:hypothetical protein
MSRSYRLWGVVLAVVGFGFACGKKSPPPTPAVEIPAEVDALAVANATGTPVVAPSIVEKEKARRGDEDDEDEEEEGPADPGPADAAPVEPVKLVLQIAPVNADVFWGGKRIGASKAGEPLVLMRPRNSGPLDLIIRAPGFLPHHTRLYTDRDDKLTVSLRRSSPGRVP